MKMTGIESHHRKQYMDSRMLEIVETTKKKKNQRLVLIQVHLEYVKTIEKR